MAKSVGQVSERIACFTISTLFVVLADLRAMTRDARGPPSVVLADRSTIAVQTLCLLLTVLAYSTAITQLALRSLYAMLTDSTAVTLLALRLSPTMNTEITSSTVTTRPLHASVLAHRAAAAFGTPRLLFVVWTFRVDLLRHGRVLHM